MDNANKVFIQIFLIIYFLRKVNTNIKCSNENLSSKPTFNLMEKCHKSQLGIAAKSRFSSLASCQKLASEKKGLALNFSPPEATEPGKEVEYTCEVLRCAEVDGGLSLVNDTNYDYYSAYAKPILHVNSTCVPGVGMVFIITKKLNYTDAIAQCKNMSGLLADITSEARTDALAQVLTDSKVEAALVALKRTNGSSFYSINGDSLDCLTYRAWAPGHPRKRNNKADCIALTKQKTWISVSCKKVYPSICELLPGGPYKRKSIFASQKMNDTVMFQNDTENTETT